MWVPVPFFQRVSSQHSLVRIPVTDHTPVSAGDADDPRSAQTLDAVGNDSVEPLPIELPSTAVESQSDAATSGAADIAAHPAANETQKPSVSRNRVKTRRKVRKKTPVANGTAAQNSFKGKRWNVLAESRIGKLVRKNPKPIAGLSFVVLALICALCWPSADADPLDLAVDDALLKLENVAISDLPEQSSSDALSEHPLANTQPPPLLIPDYGESAPQFAGSGSTYREPGLISVPNEPMSIARNLELPPNSMLPIQTTNFQAASQPAVWLTGSIELVSDDAPPQVSTDQLPSVTPGAPSARRNPSPRDPRFDPTPIQSANALKTVTATY